MNKISYTFITDDTNLDLWKVYLTSSQAKLLEYLGEKDLLIHDFIFLEDKKMPTDDIAELSLQEEEMKE